MGAKTNTDITLAARKSARRSTPTPCSNKINGRFKNSNPRTVVALNEDSSNLVTRKLDALKSIIPTQNGDDEVKADLLFKETADYILLLRTQVSILQKLVDFYGEAANRNHVTAISKFFPHIDGFMVCEDQVQLPM
ncbi:transcription factor UPBEAT1 [Heracleum sosnowskyi]|uniref:Transcription factor UPBEAT1 n=1 Tax=Heracleum sosnowskyi TaxID=360622 RepID=A0AAD8MTM6_9APIA|nr:transcription factor UPBEAT1 [Heracleum sosnowskyi]